MTALYSEQNQIAKGGRQSLFDVLKAFAMIMVVCQHAFYYIGDGIYGDCLLNNLISKIDVPIFMFVSGYFVYKSKWDARKLTIRITSLLIPFLIWSLIYSWYDNGVSITGIMNLTHRLIRDPYFCSPLWFFRALIILTVIAFACRCASDKYSFLLMCMAYVAILFIGRFLTMNYGIQSISMNCLYFLTGIATYKFCLLDKSIFVISSSLLLIGYCVYNVLIYCILPPPAGFAVSSDAFTADAAVNRIVSILGVIGFIGVTKLISTQISMPVIEYIGRHTLAIYSSHFLFIYLMRDFGVPLIPGIPIVSILLYAMVAMLCALLLDRVAHKLYPMGIIFGNVRYRYNKHKIA